ncbi:MAG TPA: sigma-70 family RNA polymerase sigma factor, partial [Verrucomicrobiae bacterium]|nr:sigma-70 family RNA polymerase sigma factor [Verrucomicrobiae bacterium]
MTDAPDARLLEQFIRTRSEEAFAALVQRHIGLVHSVALRHTASPQQAEDITQAIFIILARKAGSLGRKTVLPGWLYHTARLTAANLRRAEARRVRREQEAFMQSQIEESPPDALWRELSPQLDEAMAGLGAAERDAVVLRYFQNKSMSELGQCLGVAENTAQKRVGRALEKLRKFFGKRGVHSSAEMIAETISANAIQPAPLALAKSVTAVALAKGAAASTSTLTLIKGALKIMAWTKVKTAIITGVVVLSTAGTATVVVEKVAHHYSLRQQLPDGSVLVLNKVFFGEKHEFVHGGKKFDWNTLGQKYLVVEFGVTGKNAVSNSLVKPAFYRQFRCVIHGKTGIDYAEEFWSSGFKSYPDGFFNYVVTSIFPRDSKWLWFRVEKSPTNNPYGPWQTVADFKVPNPARPANHTWVASPSPSTNTVGDMDIVLGNVTVEQRPFSPHDIWNHVVTMPVKVFDHGVLLTNWGATYVHMEDASGNWNTIFQSHRSLDPRYVWKLDMDCEPESNFAPENLATVNLPRRGNTITKEIMGQPVTIAFDGTWIDANLSTNRSDLGLKFVGATDAQGNDLVMPAGSWDQYEFREGDFVIRRE